MKRSTSKILTTHVGSLPRPRDLDEMVQAKVKGQSPHPAMFDAGVRLAVQEIVKKQVEVGLDVVNDGEQSKSSWADYVNERLSGFGFGTKMVPRPMSLDQRMFPGFFTSRAPQIQPTCIGPVGWKDFGAVETDIQNLTEATKGAKIADAFITSASPGTIANWHPNKHYASQGEYLQAIADVMSKEYEAIVKAGIILQLDCPDLALRNTWYPDLSEAEFVKVAGQYMEALNYATRNIQPDQMRFHVCWGRGEGPKYFDPPLRSIINVLLKGRPKAISIVGANGRHEFEWRVWKNVGVPAGTVLIPGVMDNTTNVIEHPDAVAERIGWYASIVGRENVIAGVDCGFGNQPAGGDVDPKIAWAKFKSLSQGAAIATKELWKK